MDLGLRPSRRRAVLQRPVTRTSNFASVELLHEPPAGFEDIAKAFAMASHLPATYRLDLRIGLAHAGALFARGHLDGHRQVALFAEHLRKLGWCEHLLGGDQEMFGCDMLFSHPADQPNQDVDPSFIRRPAVELWPARTEQIEHS